MDRGGAGRRDGPHRAPHRTLSPHDRADRHELGLAMADVRLRMEQDYFAKIKSTFGPVRFPWFAFRGADGRTRVPARELFPLHPVMRVTEPLLEWESALAADHPFRKADALLFFTHGAADVEDNSLERHAVLAGTAIPPEWQYRRPEEFRKILQDRASRDSLSGKTVVYGSTDAHALRRFVDETWTAPWKMSNGIRVWCIDAKTGETVHLGGEYTWGDCHEVARRFEALHGTGQLPKDGDYGEGVVAQVVFVTDGIGWITEHILPLFPGAVPILDLYHALEHVADAARKVFQGPGEGLRRDSARTKSTRNAESPTAFQAPEGAARRSLGALPGPDQWKRVGGRRGSRAASRYRPEIRSRACPARARVHRHRTPMGSRTPSTNSFPNRRSTLVV